MPADVIALFGPTGVGKTAVAIELAELLRERGEEPIAISADALQVYRGLETLTGAPGAAERRRLEHRLVGQVPLTETFSAGRFAALAHAEIDTALAAGQRPIVVGGTGLYLRAALTDLSLRPPPPPALRAELESELDRRGAAAMHAELSGRAPAAAERIDPGDRSRIVRALELVEMGEPLPQDVEQSELWTSPTRLPTVLVGLVMGRDELYRRIDARVDEMLEAGVIEEVRAADAAGASRTARAALGFDELLSGDVEEMKRRTRNFARRQLTWMRKLAGVEVVDVTGLEPQAAARRIRFPR